MRLPSPFGTARGDRRRAARWGVIAATCTALVATVAVGVGYADGDDAVPVTAARASGPCPATGDDDSGWALSSTSWDTSYLAHAYVGNGYLGQRVPQSGTGYAEPTGRTGWPLYTRRYDGAFVAGLYARDPKLAGGRAAIAAIPTWSTLTVRVAGRTYSPGTDPRDISRYRQTLYLRCGLLRTSLRWRTPEGPVDLSYDVLADRVHKHVGAVRLRLRAHFDAPVTVTDSLDAAGARRISPLGSGPAGRDTIRVGFTTRTTRTDGAVVSTLRHGRSVRPTGRRAAHRSDSLGAGQSRTFPVRAGGSYEFVKYVGVDTALTSDDPAADAVTEARRAAALGWRRLFALHAGAWAALWRSDIVVPGRPDLQAAVRSGTYALLSSARPGGTSIAPSGLSSDNYAGLVFWDAEIWMYPGLLVTHPEIARSVLDYRYSMRGAARRNAARLGHRGLFFAWTSAGTGDLRTDCHSWDPPHCVTQVHLQGDIALATWQYYQATGDTRWLRERGWPLLKGIAEYWASRVSRDDDGGYSIRNVAGPDEYSNGVTDGAYTNAGAALALRHATSAAAVLGVPAPAAWARIADHLRMPFDRDRGVFVQYDGYGAPGSSRRTPRC